MARNVMMSVAAFLAATATCPPAFAAERGEQEYLIVPKGYTPSKAWPIILVGQNQVSAEQMADKPYFAMYCGPGPQCVLPLIEVAGKYHIDPFRVYATAFSRTGHAALEAAYTYPGWFAAIAPVDEDMRFKKGRAVQKIEFLKYIRTPTLLIHGEHDSFLKTGRKNYEAMRAAGCPVWWQTFKGGHNPDPIYFRNMKLLTDFFDRHVLEAYPKDVVHAVVRADATRAWWVDCEVIKAAVGTQDPPVFRVRVQEGNRIEVEADRNVLSLLLMLNDRLVDMAKPVTVVSGERQLYSGPAKGQLRVQLHEGRAAGQPARRGRPPLWEVLEAVRSQPNETGAHDWVYLEMQTKFDDPRMGRGVRRRVCLDLGLRFGDGPERAKIDPVAGKHFLPMDLTGAPSAVKADMATMSRRLPVAVSATSEAFSLVGDVDTPAGSDPIRLAPAGGRGSGQVLLVKVRLSNRGTKPVVGRVMLYRSPSFAVPRPMWPASGDFANGLYEIASTRKISNQWAPRLGMFPYQAILWLSLNPDGRLGAAQEMNEGRYKSMWGVRRSLSLAPHAALSLPLLFLSIPAADADADRPRMPDLAGILTRIKPTLLKALAQ
jgi:hypothetical protein